MNRTPGFYVREDGLTAGAISTEDGGNNQMRDSHISALVWFHASIRACGSSGIGKTCVREWGNTLNCKQTTLTGSVIPFSITSTV